MKPHRPVVVIAAICVVSGLAIDTVPTVARAQDAPTQATESQQAAKLRGWKTRVELAKARMQSRGLQLQRERDEAAAVKGDRPVNPSPQLETRLQEDKRALADLLEQKPGGPTKDEMAEATSLRTAADQSVEDMKKRAAQQQASAALGR